MPVCGDDTIQEYTVVTDVGHVIIIIIVDMQGCKHVSINGYENNCLSPGSCGRTLIRVGH